MEHVQKPATSGEAQLLVTHFVVQEIADILSAGEPELVKTSGRSYWHVPVILSYITLGYLGVVGYIDVDAHTGSLVASEELVQWLQLESFRLFQSLLIH
jgi:hypothetical protein